MKQSMMGGQGPMLFSLSNAKEGKKIYSGVLEFIAEEGRAYLPPWASIFRPPAFLILVDDERVEDQGW